MGGGPPYEEIVMTVTRLPAARAVAVPPEPNVIALPGPDEVSLVPVHRDGRAVGAYVLLDGDVRFRPVVDVDRILSAVAGIAAVAGFAAAAAARRRVPAVGAVTIGPGGWVSLKGVAAPSLRPAGHRPWWARLLRARRLVVEK
jgi:hypothetical protein